METSNPVDLARIDAIIEKWGSDREFVIEMMQDVQEEMRHLPEAALARMAEKTGADLARLYHIATFFKAFSLTPKGEIPVQVCTGTACHVRGAARVLDAMSRELGIEPGGTTPDLKFGLDAVRCLGCCTLAPVVTVGKDLHGGVDSSKVAKVLKPYRKEKKPRPEPRTEGKEAADA